MSRLYEKYGFDVYNKKDVDALMSVIDLEIHHIFLDFEFDNDFYKEACFDIIKLYYLLFIDLYEEGCIPYPSSSLVQDFEMAFDPSKHSDLYMYMKLKGITAFYEDLFDYRYINDQKDVTFYGLEHLITSTAHLPKNPIRAQIYRFYTEYYTLSNEISLFKHTLDLLSESLDIYYESLDDSIRFDLSFLAFNRYIYSLNPLDALMVRYNQFYIYQNEFFTLFDLEVRDPDDQKNAKKYMFEIHKMYDALLTQGRLQRMKLFYTF